MRSCYDLPTLERRRKIQKQNRRRPIRELNPEAFPAPLNWLGLIASLFQERCLDLDQFVSTLPSVASTSDVSVDATSPTLTPAPNPHSARCTVGAPHPAISCLGAFRTPALRAWGWSPQPASENLHTSGLMRRNKIGTVFGLLSQVCNSSSSALASFKSSVSKPSVNQP
jgi:hypothetical protein